MHLPGIPTKSGAQPLGASANIRIWDAWCHSCLIFIDEKMIKVSKILTYIVLLMPRRKN